MKKPRKSRRHTRAAFQPPPGPAPLQPVARQRQRHDGWTPERQLAFIEALAASGCVAEACEGVGVSRSAAYALRVRPEAQQFRMAWDAALDLGIRRLADECFARALHGEAVPHYFQGELIGEHRRYDNRLAMFLLRYRDPLRYAATLDQMVYSGHPEAAGVAFARARNRLLDEANGAEIIDPAPRDGAKAEFGDGDPRNTDPARTDPAHTDPARSAIRPDAGAPPHTATPLSEVIERQIVEALVDGAGPVGGSWARRERIHALRRQRPREDQAAVALAARQRLASMMSRLAAGEDIEDVPDEPPPP